MTSTAATLSLDEWRQRAREGAANTMHLLNQARQGIRDWALFSAPTPPRRSLRALRRQYRLAQDEGDELEADALLAELADEIARERTGADEAQTLATIAALIVAVAVLRPLLLLAAAGGSVRGSPPTEHHAPLVAAPRAPSAVAAARVQ